MPSSRCITVLSLLLTAFVGTAAAQERGGTVEIAPRQGSQRCLNPGWIPACTGPLPCVPPGAICCDPGSKYAIPPQKCPAGTTPGATAPLSSGGIVPTAPPTTAAPTSIPTTAPPVFEFTSYTYRFTSWYYYYFYYYIAATSTLSSSTTSWSTTIYFTASNDVAASAITKSYSSSLVQYTPTQSETPTVGTPAASVPTPTRTVVSTINGGGPSTTRTAGQVPTTNPTTPAQFTGAAAIMRVGGFAVDNMAIWVVGVLMAGPAAFMLML